MSGRKGRRKTQRVVRQGNKRRGGNTCHGMSFLETTTAFSSYGLSFSLSRREMTSLCSLMSLAPAIRQLRLDRQSWLKVRMQEMVHEAEFGTSYSQPPHVSSHYVQL